MLLRSREAGNEGPAHSRGCCTTVQSQRSSPDAGVCLPRSPVPRPPRGTHLARGAGEGSSRRPARVPPRSASAWRRGGRAQPTDLGQAGRGASGVLRGNCGHVPPERPRATRSRSQTGLLRAPHQLAPRRERGPGLGSERRGGKTLPLVEHFFLFGKKKEWRKKGEKIQ